MRALDFIEACYQRRQDLADWVRGVLGQAVKLHQRTVGIGAYLYRIGDDGRVDISQIFGPPGSELAHDPLIGPRGFVQFINGSPFRQAIVPATFGSDLTFLLLSDLPQRLGEPLSRRLPPGARDSICMRAVFQSEGFHLCALGADRFRPTERTRRYLSGLSEHVAAGYRMQRVFEGTRLDPDLALGVATAGGRLLHATDRLRQRQAASTFIDRVKSMDRLRCRRLKRDPEEAARLWDAFVDGEYSLVESIDTDGRRLILAVRTRARPGSALTPQERRVVEGVIKGHGNKAIGAELGISGSTTAVHLQSAMRKLGFRTRQSVVCCLTVKREGQRHETCVAKAINNAAVGGRDDL